MKRGRVADAHTSVRSLSTKLRPKKRRQFFPRANNTGMHKDNQYRNGYALDTFTEEHSVHQFLTDKGSYLDLDWNDPAVVHALNCSLLQRDFKRKLIFPQGRLCPSVPLRLNYLLWVMRDLLDNPQEQYTAIDIGTGSTCIYPLLGTALSNKISFYASELDEKAMSSAQSNVLNNGLKDRIHVIAGRDGVFFEPVFQVYTHGLGIHVDQPHFEFSMCNPPFFSSGQEWERNKKLSFGGVHGEMVTEGGELQFLTEMILESVKEVNRFRVRWFTTMVGIKENLKYLEATLKRNAGSTTATVQRHQFMQGRTTRWGLAWTFFPVKQGIVIADDQQLAAMVVPGTHIDSLIQRALLFHDLGGTFERQGLSFAISRSPLLSNGESSSLIREELLDIHCFHVSQEARAPRIADTPTTHPGLCFHATVSFKSSTVPSDTKVEFILKNTTTITTTKSVGIRRSIFFTFIDKMKSCLLWSRKWARWHAMLSSSSKKSFT